MTEDIFDHDTFCVQPFIHQIISSDGQLQPCCFSNNTGYAPYTAINEAWNGDYMLGLRKSVISGERHTDCVRCWLRESSGDGSFRHMYNNANRNNPIVRDIVDNAIANDLVVADPPITMEFRFGNLCNLQCKMCRSESSSQIAKDFEKLKVLDPSGYKQFGHDHQNYDPANYSWFTDPTIWDIIERSIPHLTYIHITGGEPTLSNEVFVFLEKCIELDCAKHMALSFCINATNVPERFLRLVQQFQFVSLTLSIDGVGPSYEYIRYPGDWKKVRANIERLFAELDKPHIVIGYNCAVQVFNILDIPEIIDELLAIPMGVGYSKEVTFHNMDIIDGPALLSIHQLTPLVRAVAKTRLDWWIEHRMPQIDYPLPMNTLVRMQSILAGTTGYTSNKLLNFSRFSDQNKSKKLEATLPLLYNLLLKDRSND